MPIPRFDHNWSEYPDTEAADVVQRFFWATTAITHACPIDADMIAQLRKLKRIVVTGPALVDAESCAAHGIAMSQLRATDMVETALTALLEALVTEVRR